MNRRKSNEIAAITHTLIVQQTRMIEYEKKVEMLLERLSELEKFMQKKPLNLDGYIALKQSREYDIYDINKYELVPKDMFCQHKSWERTTVKSIPGMYFCCECDKPILVDQWEIEKAYANMIEVKAIDEGWIKNEQFRNTKYIKDGMELSFRELIELYDI